MIIKTVNLEESEVIDILNKYKYGFEINNGVKISHKDFKGYSYDSNRVQLKIETEQIYKCTCKEGYDKELKNCCPYCGSGIYRNTITLNSKEYLKSYDEQLKKITEEMLDYNNKTGSHLYLSEYYGKSEAVKIYDKFYVLKHPDVECGILIKKIIITAQVKDKNIYLNAKLDKYIEIIPGESCKAYNIKRGKAEEMDLFKAFNLNSNISKLTIDLDWENSNSLFNFLDKNPEFVKRTAFMDVFNLSQTDIHRNNFFLLYMYLYSQYPVIELLAKMNYSLLISQSLSSVINSGNKEIMKKRADKLTKIFNPHGTTGKLSLNIPKYMGDYLNKVGGHYNDFESWSDIYAYEKLSKENFYEIINNENFIEIRNNLDRIADLQKYGYKVQKLINYIVKQKDLLIKKDNEYRNSCFEIIRLIIDYQKTLELLGVAPDLYPSDIKDAHDKAFRSYKLAENELTDKKLTTIKLLAQESIIEDKNGLYTIVIPENTIDFIEEGQAQHNCVATYVPNVLKDKCVIFFIRKKGMENESYITAEYQKGGLYQIKAKNNYNVTETSALEFAKDFCKSLSKNKNFKNI